MSVMQRVIMYEPCIWNNDYVENVGCSCRRHVMLRVKLMYEVNLAICNVRVTREIEFIMKANFEC